MKSYEHALEVLGSAVGRSEVKAHAQVPTDGEIAPPHVRPGTRNVAIERSESGAFPLPRARIELPDVLARASNVHPAGVDDTAVVQPPHPSTADPRESPSIAPVGGPAAALVGRHRASASVEPVTADGADAVVPVVVFDDAAPPPGAVDDITGAPPLHLPRRSRPPKLPRGRLSGARWRPVVAVGVLAGLVGAGLYFAFDRPRTVTSTSLPPPTTVASTHRPTHRPAPVAPRPSPLVPVSITTQRVSYVEPSGNYTVTFRANGPMWLGFEHQANPNGPWLATPTLGTGGLATYTLSTTGPLVIVVGAPRELAGVAVNGTSLVVPPGRVAAFDLAFEPAAEIQH